MRGLGFWDVQGLRLWVSGSGFRVPGLRFIAAMKEESFASMLSLDTASSSLLEVLLMNHSVLQEVFNILSRACTRTSG